MAEPRAGLKALQGKKQDTKQDAKTGHPFKMGRNRSVATGLRLKFRDYLTKGLPTPPATFDYSPDASSSIANIYDNDTLGDCHDAQTEVLTEHGWKKWPEYDGKSLLGTMNQQTGMLEFQAPLSLTRREHKGPMIFSDHKRLDFAITPNHRILCRPYHIPSPYVPGAAGYGQQQFVTADSLPSRCLMPGCTTGFLGTTLQKLAIGQRSWDGTDFLRLLAVILSDGYVRSDANRNSLSFCCFRDDRRDMVASLAHRLGIEEQPSRPGVWRFTDGPLADWMRANAYIGNEHRAEFKQIPDLVKVASQKQIDEFLLYFGDQHVSEKGRQFYSSSERIADDLQELLLRTGKRGAISKREPRSGGVNSRGVRIVGRVPSFTVTENLNSDISLTRTSRNPGVEHGEYDGEVFCATVPNSTLVTRRNGRILISGNCVIACLGHEVGVVTGNADGGTPFMFTNQQIINLYGAIGGYVPGNPATDQGCDIQTMLNYWVKNGAPSGSNKILGWIAVDPTDMNQVRVALYLFETLIFGIELPDAWVNNMPQASGFTWDVAGAPDPSNGHCICGVGADAAGIKIATWGMTGTLTNAACQQYAGSADGGELYTVITQEMISKATQKAPNGFDFAALVADFDSLGGSVVQPPSEQPDWPNIFAAKA